MYCEYEKCAPSEINGIIELWHIRKLFENVVPKTECLEDFEMIKSKTSEYYSGKILQEIKSSGCC